MIDIAKLKFNSKKNIKKILIFALNQMEFNYFLVFFWLTDFQICKYIKLVYIALYFNDILLWNAVSLLTGTGQVYMFT